MFFDLAGLEEHKRRPVGLGNAMCRFNGFFGRTIALAVREVRLRYPIAESDHLIGLEEEVHVCSSSVSADHALRILGDVDQRVILRALER